MIRITRTSPVTGVIHSQEIDVTDSQIEEWESGKDLIQNIMPHLTPDEREFIMTGITADEWEDTFGNYDDDDDDEWEDTFGNDDDDDD